MSGGSRSLRLWPAWTLLVLAAAALVWVWTVGETPDRQDRIVNTMTVVGLTVIALLLWWFLFSRAPGKVRLVSLGALIVVAAVGASTLRLRELSGDLVPILEWRWTAKDAVEMAPDATATAGARAAADVDFPQFLGPRRDATLPGIALARDWERDPPRLLWRQPIGAGWSGFAVAGGRAVTSEQHGDEEWVTGYDLATGELLWTHRYPANYPGNVMAGIGPRATPTIEDGRVYALGAAGVLSVLELDDGALVWTRDVVAENGAQVPEHGYSPSPLLLDGKVVVIAGGPGERSLVAYDRATGEPVWSGGDDQAGYSSPMVATLAGVRQVLAFGENVSAYDPDTGERLWSYPWPPGAQHVAQPVPVGEDRLFVSTGYGVGGKLLRIERDGAGGLAPELLWETPRLKAKFTNVVHRDGHLYGLDDGVLACVDVATGERVWKRGRYGHGHALLVGGDLLLVQTERGEILLVPAEPEPPEELARFQAIEGKSWNTPALAGRYLVVRNAEEAACYALPLAEA